MSGGVDSRGCLSFGVSSIGCLFSSVMSRCYFYDILLGQEFVCLVHSAG